MRVIITALGIAAAAVTINAAQAGERNRDGTPKAPVPYSELSGKKTAKTQSNQTPSAATGAAQDTAASTNAPSDGASTSPRTAGPNDTLSTGGTITSIPGGATHSPPMNTGNSDSPSDNPTPR